MTELSDEQQHSLDTWYDKAYQDDNLFRTLATDDGTLRLFLDWVAAMYADSRSIDLDPHLLELCRIRMANRNECFH